MEMLKTVLTMAWALGLWAGAANAATGSSCEFRIDLRGMGPWERRVARPTEAISYSSAWATNAPADAKAVVKVYPCLKEKPTYVAIDLSGGTNATRYPVESFNEIPGGSWSDEYKTSKLVLRHIPAGSFIMGGRNTDYPGAVNTNLHLVTITRDFYMGVFEVTQRQWELVMGTRPSIFSMESCYAMRPVEMVPYKDVCGENGLSDASFLYILRQKTKLQGFDLPDEEQFEYSCRAGTTTALNIGKDVVSEIDESAGMVARYGANSGRYDVVPDWTEFYTGDDTWDLSRGTAKVGSYLPNAFGLYDMHGNVWEMMRKPSDASRIVIRGASWAHLAKLLHSSVRYDEWDVSRCASIMGFRVCLLRELPDLANGLELVSKSGASLIPWTPAQSGVYCLTHEVQTNGVPVAGTLSAAFDVAGPTLSFSPEGELEPGVGVTVGGNEPDWTVYYTTDGTEPTTNSTAYAGAIALNGTTTVRAVAYNAQGVRSEEASATFTLHDALGLASAVATPRYPWNGKVDVDVELKGDPAQRYLVEVEARDLAGGTNLPVRTVVCTRPPPQTAASNVQPSTFNLQPGSHRLTWDAAADIAGDFDFNRVAVTVKATGSPLFAYPKTLELTVAGYTGTEVLTNVPTLVRLSTAIPGFSYDDFATTNGADLAFFTEDDRPLPYEIDEWNPNGESLVWVKLPVFANGTRFTAAWGNSELSTLNSQLAPHEVWRDYAGVWHMNEDSGTAFDSTEHGLDALPSYGRNGSPATLAQMIAYEDGACGRGRVNMLKMPDSANRFGNYLLVPSYDALKLGSVFVFSGWFQGVFWQSGDLNPRLVSRKKDAYSDPGWDVSFVRDPDGCAAYGSDERGVEFSLPGIPSRWSCLTVLYRGTELLCYTNGVLCATSTIAPVVDNGEPLAFGNNAGCTKWSFAGQYDELRLRGGTLSADRIKADYDMIANRRFLRYGGGSDAAQRPADATGDEIGVRGDVMTIDVSGGETAAAYKVEYFADVDIGVFNCAAYKTSKIALRKVPAGTYAAKPGASGDIGGATLTTRKDYWIGLFTVTQRQWDNVMGTGNPRLPYNREQSTDGPDEVGMRPRDYVSWNELRFGDSTTRSPAVPVGESTFFGRLIAKTGLAGFDLPTEAQWEIAARAGSTAEYGSYWKDGAACAADGSDAVQAQFAWFSGNQRSVPGAYTRPVGQLRPNLWGLYDTAGNVWEYCLDAWTYPYSDAYVDTPCCSNISKDERGGSCIGGAPTCRPSSRTSNGTPGGYDGYHGFRLARTQP